MISHQLRVHAIRVFGKFSLPKLDFLLELLIVALDTPTQLGQIDEPAELMFSSSVESQYLVGSASPLAQSINTSLSLLQPI